MAAELKVTELDFIDIKNNLKLYLSAQPEFTDYDFTGSALNTLLDVLAYNTHYNALLANFQANEMFIDTAIKRSSVVSLAKSLGYTPRSITSSKAYVDITVTKNITVGNTLSITPTVTFSSTVNGESLVFNVNETKTAFETSGQFIFENVELIEGNSLTNTFTAGPDTLSGPFVIPVPNIDIETLSVAVQDGVVTTDFTRATNIVDVTSTSKVFWIEEDVTGYYKLIFGDDILGAKLSSGNIVIVTYKVSKGDLGNGARVFSIIGSIAGETGVTVTTVTPGAGGSRKETIDEIRFNATKYNATRNRLVTNEDYRSLIKASSSKIREVTVWGGDENDPPIYGKVFISINPNSGVVITEADKEYILNNVIKPRSVMTVQHEFVEPEYLYLGLDGVVNFNPRMTNYTANEFSTLIRGVVQDYFEDEFGVLNATFFLSQLTDTIKQFSPSVVGTLFKINLQKRLNITPGTVGYSGNINFLTSIDPETLQSSKFTSLISNNFYVAYLQDYPDDVVQNDNGTGTINLINATTGAVITSVGRIDYKTGLVSINNLNVYSYLGNLDKLYISAKPQSLAQNISSSQTRTTETSSFAVTPNASRNTIIVLDDSTANNEANITAGLIINSIPFVE